MTDAVREMIESAKAVASWADPMSEGGVYDLVRLQKALAALDKPEVCRPLPAAEQAVEPLLDDWLLFAADIQPACAAGHDWLDSLRSRTQIALAKLRQGEKPACLPEPPEGE